MALDIWGRVVPDHSDYDIAEAEKAARVREAIAAHMAQHPAARAEPVAPREVDPPPTPEAESNTQGLRSAAAGNAVRPSHTSPRSADPVHVLDAALNAAVDDVGRAALLAAAPKQVREQLAALSGYKAFMRPIVDVYDAFEHALGAAANDAERAALIAGGSPAFLVEWAWRTRATSEDWRRRYLSQVGGSELG